MMIPPRALVAAQLLARDHGHLIGTPTCTVVLGASVIETILTAAGRRRWSGFQPTAYDASPLALHALPAHALRRIRTSTKNKRLHAALDLAYATASTISFVLPETRLSDGSLTVDIDLDSVHAYRNEAAEAAARYLRIEHAQAMLTLRNRGGQSLASLDFDVDDRFGVKAYPEDADQCVALVLAKLHLLSRWVRDAIAEANAAEKRGLRAGSRTMSDGRVVSLSSDDIVDRLEIRADIRRNAAGRKSVEEGKADRLAALLDEAAAEIRRLRNAA